MLWCLLRTAFRGELLHRERTGLKRRHGGLCPLRQFRARVS